MTDIIFRFTSPGDTIGGLSDSEKIEFNAGSIPDATGRSISSAFRMSRDTNIHPNPRRVLNQIQDSLLGLTDITITGYFVSHASTLGPKNFYNWQREDGTNASLPFGRFGLQIPSFANGLLDQTPTATTAYLLYDIDVQDVDDPRDKVPFIARFYLNGTAVAK